MRTDDPGAPLSVRAWLRARLDRAYRWAVGRGRWVVGATVLAALLAAGAYFTTAASTTGQVLLYASQHLPRESADAVVAQLDAAGIPFEVTRQGQVAVPADRKDEALAALSKT